jgi:hypothetical protein
VVDQRLLDLIRTIGEKSQSESGQSVKQQVHALLWNVSSASSTSMQCVPAVQLGSEGRADRLLVGQGQRDRPCAVRARCRSGGLTICERATCSCRWPVTSPCR